MNNHTITVVYVGCFVLAVLLGVLRGYIKYQTRKIKDAQRDLIKWQMELEKRASEIRKNSR